MKFVQADLGGALGDLGLFDAVVGRRVLMYQPDTIGTARNLASSLHPGGLIVFQEHDTTMVRPAGRQCRFILRSRTG